MNNYVILISAYQSLQSQMIKLWEAILEMSPEKNNVPGISWKDLSWHEQIMKILERENKPLTAREIATILAPLRKESVEDIIDRVNTNCATARLGSLIGFLANPGNKKRGRYTPLNYKVNPASGSEIDFDDFINFKTWLQHNGVMAAADTYAARLRMIEARLLKPISILTNESVDNLLNRIDSFQDLGYETLQNLKTAVRKFVEYRNYSDTPISL